MTTDTIEAPTPVAGPKLSRTQDIPLGLIAPSPMNPRRHHLDAAIERRRWNLDELAESIRLHGVMQPILVRPKPDVREGDGQPRYELVAGERRWLASALADQPSVPAMVRDLTDIQALELQVIENGQREDLHPLEEALGFRHLLDTPGGYNTPEEIAARVGKTVRWVYNRLKLLDLHEDAQRAFFAGEISASVALELAEGVPDAHEHPKHLQVLIQGWGGEPLSARAARKHLRENAMLRLDRAPFDAAITITVVPFASVDSYHVPDTRTVRAVDVGPCAKCPKHTGAKPDFFEDDVKEGDRCQDPACFKAKSAAAHEQLLQAARAEGVNVVSGPAAKKFMPSIGHRPKDHYYWDRPCTELTDSPEALCKLIKLDPNYLTVVDHPDQASGVITVAHELYVKDALRTKGLLRKVQAPPPAPAKKAAGKKPKNGGGALLPAAAKPDPAAPHFAKALDFPVFPPEFKGQPTQGEVRVRTREAEQRATSLLVGHALARHLDTDESFGLPSEGISRLLLVLMSYGDMFMDIRTAALALDLDPPAAMHLGRIEAWAWALDEESAAKLVLVLLALQVPASSKVIDAFPAAVAKACNLDERPFVREARELVAERVKVELLARAAPAKAKAAAKRAAA